MILLVFLSFLYYIYRVIGKGFIFFALLFCAATAWASEASVAVDAPTVKKESEWPTILLEQGSLVDLLPKTEANQHWTHLPIWGAEAEQRGYTLEPPLVLGVQYVNQSQYVQQEQNSLVYSNIKTENLFGLNGLNLGKNPDGTPNIHVSTGRTKEHTEVKGVRAGAWIFPFLQAYGTINEVRGEAKTYTTSLTQLELPVGPIGSIIEAALRGIFKDSYKGNGLVETAEVVKLKLDGTSYGGGLVFAGGYKKYFFIVDANYTYTDFDFATNYAKALVVSTRVGYDAKLLGRPFRFWTGFMSQNVSSRVTGKMRYLDFEGLTGQLTDAINPNGEGEFEVRQKLHKPVNALLGARYTITPHAALLVEGGYGGPTGRTSILGNFEFLF